MLHRVPAGTMVPYSLLLALTLLLSGCPMSLPPYQPRNASTFHSPPGYEDYQLDSDTFVITYVGQDTFRAEKRLDNKWMHVAQQYVLYRAAELTINNGRQYFGILHKDDWNLVGWSRGRRRRPLLVPGARLVIRLLSEPPPKLQEGLMEAESLLLKLPRINRELSLYRQVPFDPASGDVSDFTFTRWRSVVAPFEPVPLTEEGLNISLYNPETKITRLSEGQFLVEMWSRDLLSTVSFLGECARLAEREGYEHLQLDDWIEEEHRGGPEDMRVWFRTKATVNLISNNHRDALATVFSVKEIKPNVDHETIQRIRQAEQHRTIQHDLDSGLVY